jgi:hypothetical protein
MVLHPPWPGKRQQQKHTIESTHWWHPEEGAYALPGEQPGARGSFDDIPHVFLDIYMGGKAPGHQDGPESISPSFSIQVGLRSHQSSWPWIGQAHALPPWGPQAPGAGNSGSVLWADLSATQGFPLPWPLLLHYFLVICFTSFNLPVAFFREATVPPNFREGPGKFGQVGLRKRHGVCRTGDQPVLQLCCSWGPGNLWAPTVVWAGHMES